MANRALALTLVIAAFAVALATFGFLYFKVGQGYFQRGNKYGWAFLAPLLIGLPLILIITVIVAAR
jgi:uncharacterized membrane protein